MSFPSACIHNHSFPATSVNDDVPFVNLFHRSPYCSFLKVIIVHTILCVLIKKKKNFLASNVHFLDTLEPIMFKCLSHMAGSTFLI
jgi:hypothetical protein